MIPQRQCLVLGLAPYCGPPVHCPDIRAALTLIMEAPTGWYESSFTTWGVQQTSADGRTAYCPFSFCWKQNLVISFIFVRVYSLATVEWREFLPGPSLSTLALKRHEQWPFIYFWCLYCGYYISIVELLPCAASSTWTWVNQLATLVHWLGWCRTTTCYNLESLGTLFAGIAMSSWRSTERHEDLFWKRSVSPWLLGVFFGVLFWVVFVFGFVSCSLWKTPGFLLFTCSRTMGE